MVLEVDHRLLIVLRKNDSARAPVHQYRRQFVLADRDIADPDVGALRHANRVSRHADPDKQRMLAPDN